MNGTGIGKVGDGGWDVCISIPRLKQEADSCYKEHVGRTISRVGEEAGIIVQQEDPENGRRQKYASAHDLRRGCAQRLINAGVSAETLKVVMRHHDFATTEKFYGATRAAQSAAAEIEERLAAGLKRTESAEGEEAPRLTVEEIQKLKALLTSI